MKLKTGDKVRFLNEALEGIVTAVISNDMVEVTDENGFAHAALERHLVKVEFDLQENIIGDEEYDSEEPENNFLEKFSLSNPPSGGKVERKSQSHSTMFSSLDDDETIYAGVILKDDNSPLTSDIELFLVNNCSYAIAFSISKKNDDFRTGISSGILKQKNEMLIGSFTQDEMHRFDGFAVQFLFFKEGQYKPRPPADKSFHISSSDFIESLSRSRTFGTEREKMKSTNERVMLLPLYFINREADVDVKKLLDKFQHKEEEEQKRTTHTFNKAVKARQSKEKFIVLNKEKVVDLHIEELLKDFSGMNNAQIIAYQINYFLYELDQAIINRLHKITFIHGVGQGVLKSAIREELKNYPNLRFAEAPAEKFGYGATEVVFD